MKKTIKIASLQATRQLAQAIGTALTGKQALILLKGDLGAGKTTFTKALGETLGVKKIINSPTFTILKSYRMGDGRMLYHMDAYRMEGIEQDLGFEEIFEEDAICVVEWPDFIIDQLPKDYLSIEIHRTGEEERDFLFTTTDTMYEQIVEVL